MQKEADKIIRSLKRERSRRQKQDLNAYQESVVAVIDILGFREHIHKLTNTKGTVNKNAVSSTITTFKYFKDRVSESKRFSIYDRQRITNFSDSIVISYPLNQAGGIFCLLLDVLHIQKDILTLGYATRGGVAIGKLFHSEIGIFGPAFVKAYDIEKKVAVYPRIVVSEDVIGKSALNPVHDAYSEIEEILHLLKEDFDGLYYIDYLIASASEYEKKEEHKRLLIEARKVAIKTLKDKDIGISAKGRWLARYFNTALDSFPAHNLSVIP